MSDTNRGFHRPEDIGPVMIDIRTHADMLYVQEPDIFDSVAALLGSGIAEGVMEQGIDARDVRRLHAVYKHGASCLIMRENEWSSADRRNHLHFRLGVSATFTSLQLIRSQGQQVDIPRNEPRYFRFLQ